MSLHASTSVLAAQSCRNLCSALKVNYKESVYGLRTAQFRTTRSSRHSSQSKNWKVLLTPTTPVLVTCAASTLRPSSRRLQLMHWQLRKLDALFQSLKKARTTRASHKLKLILQWCVPPIKSLLSSTSKSIKNLRIRLKNSIRLWPSETPPSSTSYLATNASMGRPRSSFLKSNLPPVNLWRLSRPSWRVLLRNLRKERTKQCS